MEHMEERWWADRGYVLNGNNKEIGLAATIIEAQAICVAHNAALDRAAQVKDGWTSEAIAKASFKSVRESTGLQVEASGLPRMTNAELHAAIDATVYALERAKERIA
jgi:hypothetical protein